MNNRNYNPTPRFFNIVHEPIIGKSCSLVDTLLDCYGQITIGDYVSFGHGCMILTAKHDKHLKGEERQLKSFPKNITIGDGAWIASGCIVCASVGENSVIGAGSVVLHDIPANVFAAGIPCRIIKDL